MAEERNIQKDLQDLAADLKRLEAEYNMFFAGRIPRPPWVTRKRVETIIKHYDRGHIESTGDRFRFETLQARFQTLSDLWDRGLRAREEGRPGPFSPAAPKVRERKPDAGDVLHAAAFRDPVREIDKLQELYESLMDARRRTGEEAVPFHKFAALVTSQVTKLRDAGHDEVAFRVAMKDGKVAFTARGLKNRKK